MTSPDAGSNGARTRRSDLASFAIYCIAYAVFMALLAFSPDVLAKRVVGGVNLAVAYGMGLILGAVALAGIAMAKRRGGPPA
jgi:uncharacterized membrane protein (DUF485 family)